MATPAEPREEKLRTVGIEPGVAWNLGPGAIDFFPRGEPQPWIPVLLRLKGIGARDFASGEKLVGVERLEAWRKSMRVSPLFTEPPPGLSPELQATFDSLDLVVAHVQTPFFEFLNDESLGLVETYIERLAVSPPLPARSLHDEAPAPPRRASTGEERAPGPVRKGILARFLEGMASLVRRGAGYATPSTRRRKGGPDGPAVVVGIIDDGIAFAHENFREPGGGSRVEFFWMQDGSARLRQASRRSADSSSGRTTFPEGEASTASSPTAPSRTSSTRTSSTDAPESSTFRSAGTRPSPRASRTEPTSSTSRAEHGRTRRKDRTRGSSPCSFRSRRRGCRSPRRWRRTS